MGWRVRWLLIGLVALALTSAAIPLVRGYIATERDAQAARDAVSLGRIAAAREPLRRWLRATTQVGRSSRGAGPGGARRRRSRRGHPVHERGPRPGMAQGAALQAARARTEPDRTNRRGRAHPDPHRGRRQAGPCGPRGADPHLPEDLSARRGPHAHQPLDERCAGRRTPVPLADRDRSAHRGRQPRFLGAPLPRGPRARPGTRRGPARAGRDPRPRPPQRRGRRAIPAILRATSRRPRGPGRRRAQCGRAGRPRRGRRPAGTRPDPGAGQSDGPERAGRRGAPARRPDRGPAPARRGDPGRSVRSGGAQPSRRPADPARRFRRGPRRSRALDRLKRDQADLLAIRGRILAEPGNNDLRARIAAWMFAHGRDQEGLGWAMAALSSDPGHLPTCRLLADYYAARPAEAGLANFYRLKAASAGDPR